MINISNILDGDRGKNYPKQEDFSDNNYCLFLTTKNVSKKGFNLDSTQFISKNKDEILRKGRLERNDLVITTRGTVGNIAFFNQDVPFDIVRINSGMAIIRITTKDLSHSFANLYLKSNLFYRYVSNIISGSAQPQITITKLKNLTVPIPPLPQQEKIVKVLDISSALIEKQRELIAKYDLFLKSKFIEMFGDPVLNPMGWEIKKIQEVCFTGSGGTPSRKKAEYYGGDIPWIKSGELNLGIITQTSEYITKEGLSNSSAKLIKPNSVLVAMYGATVGVSAITKIEATSNQAVCYLNPKKNDLDENFLLSFFRFIKKELINKSVGGGQPNISQEIIKNIIIILPPIVLQNKFASIVEKTETIKTQENQKLVHLETLHSSLMDKAFKGEIR